ncbi:MAG: peptidoglycan-binding protein, partial [Aristaeellaceae bacterium]
LQERLIELDYLEGTADGDFGNGTKEAVIAFQKNNDLSADGVAGEQTLTILFSDQAVRQHWVWIPTNGGEKYHSKSSCSGMENPKRVTYREAIEQGYDACGKCY